MANNSINDLAFLNQIITETDDIRMLLSKATALMHVASDNNFLNHPDNIVELYLSVIFDFLDKSRDMSHIMLQSLKEEKITA